MSEAASRLGVLVPCRNEAAVIGRKLEDLARVSWPEGGAGHRVLVVDDHSTDGTAELAEAQRSLLAACGVDLEVLRSVGRPGKNGALESGLSVLAEQVDLVVLTDADVLLDSNALERLAAAFVARPRLGMACGEQVFVRSLAGQERVEAAAGWDRWTARVRRLESRFGGLFSVHGQLLAWRAELGLAPRPGVAADDVDLMLQVRGSATSEVALISGARFFEEKQPAGSGGAEQALRRARAWFQVFEGRRRPAGFEGLAAVQWLAYSRLPGLLPWIVPTLGVMLLAAAVRWAGAAGGGLMALALLAAWASPVGREWTRTLLTIARARRLERRAPLEEAWETTRS
jgi:hypothetical protein